MHAFDASSLIHAWDNYPLKQFPPIWQWMARRIQEEKFIMPIKAFEEVEHISPDCGKWLKDQSVVKIPMSNAISQEALTIKRMLGIVGDAYHPNGVDENDLFIIATAKKVKLPLVSDEGKQQSLPKTMSKYKIPAVCDMKGVDVKCIRFIELIKSSGEVFR